MMGADEIEPFTAQVGGHRNLLVSQDRSLVFKPSSLLEKSFYELVSAEDERLIHLKPFVPSFYGVLTLQGELQGKEEDLASIAVQGESGSLLPPPADAVKDKCEILFQISNELILDAPLQTLVLENVASDFTCPNIIDIKLGTILYDEFATPEKKERMERRAIETTSGETGIRLTGFQTYDYDKKEAVLRPKSYGRSLKAVDLPEGIAVAFPRSEQDEKDSPHGTGLPSSLLLPILEGLIFELREIADALSKTPMRFIGVSVLIVYEAHWEMARLALDTIMNQDAGTASVSGPVGSDKNEDVYLDLADKSDPSLNGGEDRLERDDDIEFEDDSEDEGEDIHPLYRVKLIDFAHSRFADGEDTDTGVLLGLATTITLLKGRVRQLKAEMERI